MSQKHGANYSSSSSHNQPETTQTSDELFDIMDDRDENHHGDETHDFNTWFFDEPVTQIKTQSLDTSTPSSPSRLLSSTSVQQSISAPSSVNGSSTARPQHPTVYTGSGNQASPSVAQLLSSGHSLPTHGFDQTTTSTVRGTNWDWDTNESLNLLPTSEIPPTFDASVLKDLQTLDQSSREEASQESSTKHSAITSETVKELEEQLTRLGLELEEKLYQHATRISRMKQTERELKAVRSISSLPPPPRSHMSLFTDDRGFAPPSTPEGLQKAVDKVQLPLYRKKYDWNLHVCTEKDKKCLMKLIASKVQSDVCKLMVEEKSYDGILKAKSIPAALRQARDSLDQMSGQLTDKKGNVMSMSLFNRMELLKEQLQRKLERDKFSHLAANDFKEIFTLPELDSGRATGVHIDLSESILKKYWTDFWDSIAVAMSSKFEWSGRDCQVQWIHHLNPKVNRKEFTKEEDEELARIAKEHEKRDWELIANELGTRRTAYQCFERYQRRHNKDLVRVEWTPDEDVALIAAVEEIGHELTGPSRWTRIAQRLMGRSNFQCRARYLHALKSDLRHGHWTKHEDICLQLLVGAYGRGKWTKMARHMPWRTDTRVRDRYENVLRPPPKKDWTSHDNNHLLAAVRKHGTNSWDAVAVEVPGNRTAKQCEKQFQQLNPLTSALNIALRNSEKIQEQDEPQSESTTTASTLTQLLELMRNVAQQQITANRIFSRSNQLPSGFVPLAVPSPSTLATGEPLLGATHPRSLLGHIPEIRPSLQQTSNIIPSSSSSVVSLTPPLRSQSPMPPPYSPTTMQRAASTLTSLASRPHTSPSILCPSLPIIHSQLPSHPPFPPIPTLTPSIQHPFIPSLTSHFNQLGSPSFTNVPPNFLSALLFSQIAHNSISTNPYVRPPPNMPPIASPTPPSVPSFASNDVEMVIPPVPNPKKRNRSSIEVQHDGEDGQERIPSPSNSPTCETPPDQPEGFFTDCKQMAVLKRFLDSVRVDSSDLETVLDEVKQKLLRQNEQELGLPPNAHQLVTLTTTEKSIPTPKDSSHFILPVASLPSSSPQPSSVSKS